MQRSVFCYSGLILLKELHVFAPVSDGALKLIDYQLNNLLNNMVKDFTEFDLPTSVYLATHLVTQLILKFELILAT